MNLRKIILSVAIEQSGNDTLTLLCIAYLYIQPFKLFSYILKEQNY